MTPDDWARLVDDHDPLVRAAAVTDSGDPGAVMRLRTVGPTELVPLAFELAAGRRAVATKYPDHPSLLADRAGGEQATSAIVAAHKARRFTDADAESVVDLCCGIGGDLIALPRAEGYDFDPVRAWMAARNASCTVHCADITELSFDGRYVHLDPSRRDDTGRRFHRYEDYQPGPEVIASLIQQAHGGAVKLGPGVDFSVLPHDGTECEVISERGTLVQMVLWSGALAQSGLRTATRLPDDLTYSAAIVPILSSGDPALRPDRILLVPDPALERAGLVGARIADRSMDEIHPGLGLLVANDDPGDPWFNGFRVLEVLPLREKRIKAALRAMDAGIVTVRTRGRAVETDKLQKTLRGKGARPITLFGLRLGVRRIAVLTEPLA